MPCRPPPRPTISPVGRSADGVAPLEVGQVVGRQHLVQVGVDRHHRHLLVLVDGPGIEVDRPEHRQGTVGDDLLDVIHGRLEPVQIDTGIQEPARLLLCREERHPLVDVRARDRHPHLHTSLSRLDQQAGQPLGRVEVGRADPQPLPGEGDDRLEGPTGAVELDLRRGVDDSEHRVAGRRRARRGLGHRERPPPGVTPIRQERRPQRVDRRPLDLEVGVPPFVGVAGVAFPLLGDPDPAGEGEPVVDHQDLAVGAVVALPDLPPDGRAEPAQLHPGARHDLDQIGRHLLGTDRVEEDPHLVSRPGALGQRMGHLLGDVARPVDVGDEVDAPPGEANGPQHGGEDLHPVPEARDGVALGEDDADVGLQCSPEGVVGEVAHPNSIPWARGRSSPQLIVVVWRRM